MPRARTIALALTLSLATAGRLLAAPAPAGVSPGEPDRPTLLAGACPTFSWGVSPGESAWELVVYGVGPGAQARAPVLRETLPAGATSWTPPAEKCPRAGATYAWAVHRLDGGTAFSRPLFFTTPAAPTSDDVARALDVLRRYETSRGDPTSAVAGTGAAPLAAPRGKSILASDSTAVVAENTDTSGKAVGLEGSTASSNGGSAGVAAIATASTGPTVGIVASQASPQGMTALLMASQPGSLLILGKGPPGNVFAVDAAGAVTATSLAGDGTNVTHVNADTVGGHPAGDFMPAGTDNWVNTTGDAMTGSLSTTGNISAAGNFLWSSSRTYYETLEASAFTVDYFGSSWEIQGGAYDLALQSTQVFWAPFHVPTGATLASVTIFAYDDDASADVTVTATPYRRALSSTTLENLAGGVIFLSTSGASTLIRTTTGVVSAAKAAVDNQSYGYGIQVAMLASATSANIRFYGAQVAYTLPGPAN